MEQSNIEGGREKIDRLDEQEDIERFENSIRSVKSIDGLCDLISSAGRIPGVGMGDIAAMNIRRMFMEGNLAELMQYMPKEFGIRDAVERLLPAASIEKSISGVGSFKELYRMLEKIVVLPDVSVEAGQAGIHMRTDALIETIKQVVEGVMPLNSVTRTAGLRSKIEELMNQNRKEKEGSRIDDLKKNILSLFKK